MKENMKIVDANIVLRYLLDDSEKMSEKAAEILENNEVYVPNEVIAEIVYVLEKVYKVENSEISDVLLKLFGYANLQVNDIEIVHEVFIQHGNSNAGRDQHL